MFAARLLYVLLFLYVGAHGNYFGIWLRDEAGWSEAAVGWQGGLHHACLIIFPLWWAHLIDRSSDPGRVLRFISIGAALTFIPFVLTMSVAGLLVVTVIFAAFRTGMVTSADAFTLARLAEVGGDYGRVRVWGSAGFIVGGFALAGLVSVMGRAAIPWVLWVILAATAVIASSLPRPADVTTPPSESLIGGLRRLLSQAPLRRFYAVAFASRLVAQGLFTFLPLHLKDLGVSEAAVPAFWAIGVVAEILLMSNAQRLFGRFTARGLLTGCLAIAALQYGLIAWVTSQAWLLAVMLLHGMSFGIWYYASVTWLGSNVADSDRARAQGLFQSLSFGVGGTVSAVACGYLYEVADGATMFAVAALGTLAVTVGAWLWLPRTT